MMSLVKLYMLVLFNEQHDFNIGKITSKQLIELQREDQSLTELWEGIELVSRII